MESEILIRSQAHSTVTYHLSGSMLVQLRLISRHRIFIPYFCKTVSNLRLTLPSTIFFQVSSYIPCPSRFSLSFYHGATALVGQGLLFIEDSWSHSDTSHTVGLLWTSDQLDTETSTWHTTHNPAVFETTIPASQRPQTHALDHKATGIGSTSLDHLNN